MPPWVANAVYRQTEAQKPTDHRVATRKKESRSVQYNPKSHWLTDYKATQ